MDQLHVRTVEVAYLQINASVHQDLQARIALLLHLIVLSLFNSKKGSIKYLMQNVSKNHVLFFTKIHCITRI